MISELSRTMGGHWGTSSSTSDRSTVRAQGVADALENWTYSTSPSDRDAIARRLSEAFPGATVRRGDGSTPHDVVADDVHVVIAHRIDSAFRRDFHTLADQVDDLVVYSTTCHTSTPNEWREFKHRLRGRHIGATVRFAHRRASGAGAGAERDAGAVRSLAMVALPMLAIGGLLAASLGLFSTGGSVLPGFGAAVLSGVGIEGEGYVAGVADLVAFVATITYLLTRRRIYVPLLRRIPHT